MGIVANDGCCGAALTKGIDLYDFNILRRQYGERNEKGKDGEGE